MDGCPCSVSKRPRSYLQSHIGDPCGPTAHFDLQLGLGPPSGTHSRPRFLKNVDDEPACRPQLQVAFSYRALKHRALSQRHLFPIAAAFCLCQVDNGIKRPSCNAQGEPRQLVDEETGQAELVQGPTTLGLHGPQVEGEPFGNKEVSGRKIAAPRPFEAGYMPGIVNLDGSRGQRRKTGFWRDSTLAFDQYVRPYPFGMANAAGPGPPTGEAVATIYWHRSAGHDGARERRYPAAAEHLLDRF